jgi:D-xylose transport system substrate-binding protein
MQVSTKFRFLLLSVALFLSMAFAACGANSSNGGSSNTTSAIKIAFLMPCSTCADRFEKQDKPLFIQAVKALDPSIQVIADNAQGSSVTQLAQTEAALTNGANVIVISPLDSATGVAVVGKASAQHVPVVSYDGLLTGARVDYYVSFPNEQVGELQGQFLLAHVKPGGTIVMINGSQDIDPGREFKAGAHKVLDPAFASGRLKLGFEADIHQFDPSKAQAATEQALTKLNNKVDGVLVANDGMAGGVIAALTEQKLNGKVLVTGQDATDTGLQRILVGDQTMTVYKAIKQEATYAAKIAVNLAKGDRASANSLATSTVNNGAMDVPSVLLTPVVVTKDNIFSTVVADGFTTRARICVGAAAAQCPS